MGITIQVGTLAPTGEAGIALVPNKVCLEGAWVAEKKCPGGGWVRRAPGLSSVVEEEQRREWGGFPVGGGGRQDGVTSLGAHGSGANVLCNCKNAPIEKPPLTCIRVTQLSYPIMRTDPELSTVFNISLLLPCHTVS